MARPKRGRITPLGDINLTSLMDLAYSLLIVFMLTTPLMNKQIKINVPTVKNTKQLQDQDSECSIDIDENGRYFVNGMPVLQNELYSYCNIWSQRNPIPVVKLRADGTLQYQVIASTLDIIKFHGINKIALLVK